MPTRKASTCKASTRKASTRKGTTRKGTKTPSRAAAKTRHKPPSPPLGTPRGPEPGSLDALIHANGGHPSLYVPPLQWTQKHLDALGVSFQQGTRDEDDQDSDSAAFGYGDDPWRGAVRHGRQKAARAVYQPPPDGPWDTFDALDGINGLGPLGDPVFKKKRLDYLLADFGLSGVGDWVEFWFRKQAQCELNPRSMYQTRSGRISLAYTDFLKLLRDRQPIERGPRIKPEKPHYDPFIVGLLIALAQAQQYEEETNKRHGTKTKTKTQTKTQRQRQQQPHDTTADTTEYTVGVLATAFMDSEVLYMYRARIPVAFLRRLESPGRYIPCPPVVVMWERKRTTELRETSKWLWEMLRDNGWLEEEKQQDKGRNGQNDG